MALGILRWNFDSLNYYRPSERRKERNKSLLTLNGTTMERARRQGVYIRKRNWERGQVRQALRCDVTLTFVTSQSRLAFKQFYYAHDLHARSNVQRPTFNTQQLLY